MAWDLAVDDALVIGVPYCDACELSLRCGHSPVCCEEIIRAMKHLDGFDGSHMRLLSRAPIAPGVSVDPLGELACHGGWELVHQLQPLRRACGALRTELTG